MNKFYVFFAFLIFSLTSNTSWGQIISQYVETNSGTTPKGIEIYNNTENTLDFAANNLAIQQGNNGNPLTTVFTISTGTLSSGEVMVIGTSDIGTYLTGAGLGSVRFEIFAFAFNGDDALALVYGGTTTDVFGNPGSDPGSAWSGNGVSTANQNIALLEEITTGSLTGWTDPSLRFSTISTTPATLPAGLLGFGIPPTVNDPTIFATPSSLTDLNYIIGAGPSDAKTISIQGINLDGTDVIVTSPTNFEISLDDIAYTNSDIILPAFDGSATAVYVRLQAGLALGTYSGDVTIDGGGISDPIFLELSGAVTEEVEDMVFEKINSIDDLNDGYYILAYGGFAMNNTHNGTYLGNTAINPLNDEILNPDASIIWKLESNGGGMSIYNEASAKYVSYIGSNNNVQVVDAVTSNNQRWNITFDIDGGDFWFSNIAVSTRRLQYNASDPRFACYTGSQQDITLYKLRIQDANDYVYENDTWTPSYPPSGEEINVTVVNGVAPVSADLSINDLTLEDGTLQLDAANLTVNGTLTRTGSGYVATDGSGSLTLLADVITDIEFPVGSSTLGYQPFSVQFITAPDLPVSARFIAGAPGGAEPNIAIPVINTVANTGYWEINSAATITYALTATANNFNGIIDGNNLRMIKRANDADAWTLAGSVGSSTGDNVSCTLEAAGIVGFSQFGVGGELDVTLPVEWLRITAREENGQVKVLWSTGEERHNDYFEVERSEAGRVLHFRTLGRVEGNAITARINHYDFTDLQPVSGTAIYRIRQVDVNGAVSFSPQVRLVTGRNAVDIYHHSNQLSFSGDVNDAQLRVYNLRGDIVFQKAVVQASVVDMSGLQPGMYVAVLTQDGQVVTEKVMVQ